MMVESGWELILLFTLGYLQLCMLVPWAGILVHLLLIVVSSSYSTGLLWSLISPIWFNNVLFVNRPNPTVPNTLVCFNLFMYLLQPGISFRWISLKACHSPVQPTQFWWWWINSANLLIYSIGHPFTAYSVAKLFIDNVYRLHGLPSAIISDQDRIFTGHLWKLLFKLGGTELRMSSAYHPQTDGQTERVNQCLETYLRCFVHACPTKWSSWLSLAKY